MLYIRHITFVKQIPNKDKNLLALLPSVDTSNVSIGAVTAIYCALSGRHPAKSSGTEVEKNNYERIQNVETTDICSLHSLLRKIE
jgi:hypothetical protein